MATTREIPGYYYDPDKQKYFKIAKSHTVPATAPYSADAVRKRKADDEARHDAAAVQKMSRGRIQRAAVLGSALLGGGLARECGGRLGERAAGRRTYVEGWAERTVLGQVRAGAFDVDMETGTMVFGYGGDSLWSAEVDADGVGVERDYGGCIGREPGDCRRTRLADGLDVVGSVAIDPVTKFVLATWVAPVRGDNVSLRRIDGRGSFADVAIGWRLESRPSRRSGAEPQATTRCTATAPASSPYSFAVGGDHPLFLIRKDGSEEWPPLTGPPLFALEFLAHDPAVLLAGQRSGHIDLLDLRMPRCASGRAGLAHAASVARIRQLSDHAVVVAGLRDTLCVYDLRYAKAGPRGHTRPAVEMRGHRNLERHDADVAVDRAAGVVAAAQAGPGTDAVVVFDAGTGEALRRLPLRGVLGWPCVRQVRFVEGRGLWAAAGEAVVEYAW